MEHYLIKGARTFLDDGPCLCSVAVRGEMIEAIYNIGQEPASNEFDEVIDASGLYLMPGIIDDHVHFREPGLTAKADIFSESRAAAAGGITSYMEMPNCVPQTTTFEAWSAKMAIAEEKSLVNYSFFLGATKDNTGLFPALDPKGKDCRPEASNIPGIKLFMGSSTGNMLVDGASSLDEVFARTPDPVIIMAHCEDTEIINANMKEAVERYGEDPAVSHHPDIRSREACISSSSKACALARKHGKRLHIAHISTREELELLDGRKITGEACVAHLLFDREDYARLGTRIKCNPSVKERSDRDELRKALSDGRITLIGTDHAPHLPSDKEGGARKAASGMPMVQFSLVSMLELAREGVISPMRVVQLMCHNPAGLFSISRRGHIREGYYADLVLVDPSASWRLGKDDIISKCGWSPLEGRTFSHKVVRTICNGKTVYLDGRIIEAGAAKALVFRKG